MKYVSLLTLKSNFYTNNSNKRNFLDSRFLDDVNLSKLHSGDFWNFGQLAKFKQLQMRRKEIEILTPDEDSSALKQLWKKFIQDRLAQKDDIVQV